jgi:hypothetical protein
MDCTNKFDCYSLASLSSLVLCNTLAYWADFYKLQRKCSLANTVPGSITHHTAVPAYTGYKQQTSNLNKLLYLGRTYLVNFLNSLVHYSSQVFSFDFFKLFVCSETEKRHSA